MKRASKLALIAACASAAFLGAGVANASLNVFQTYSGSVGLSTSGCGSVSQSCDLTANVPAGSTIVAAYLYSSMFSTAPAGGAFGGSAVSYTPLGVNAGVLQASRADVTSIVAAAVTPAGGAFNFNVTETNGAQDGEALVVVYSNGSLATSTIGILDGFSASTGDNSSITFASPLHPGAPGFQAEMRIGDGFSCDSNCSDGAQVSQIDVNGLRMTNVAGDNDDSIDGSNAENGNLITVGGDNDPFTVAAPGSPQNVYQNDHERYDLTPFINDGDTAIHIHTLNPSNDDNIFLETFLVTGQAVVSSGTPEPATWAMMILGFFGLGSMVRRKSVATA